MIIYSYLTPTSGWKVKDQFFSPIHHKKQGHGNRHAPPSLSFKQLFFFPLFPFKYHLLLSLHQCQQHFLYIFIDTDRLFFYLFWA